MSIATLILGQTGTGKSFSMMKLDPKNTLLIQAVKKPLPFKSKDWSYFEKKKGGNIFVCDDTNKILAAMRKTQKKVIVIDDFQYIMSNEFMRRYNEKGFDRFNEIARHAWDVLSLANVLLDDVRVYILGHTTTDEFGNTKVKTIGKMLDEKITIEGLFSIVLKTVVSTGDYKLSTKNSGQDTVKTPFELFDDDLIDNDLKFIDDAICEYYNIKEIVK